EDARARAMTWDASIQGLPEWRCRPHSADYAVRSPQHEQIWAVWDDITREVKEWHIANERDSSDRVIYMDGRPHPGPNARAVRFARPALAFTAVGFLVAAGTAG